MFGNGTLDIWEALIVVIVSLILSGMFAAGETALTADLARPHDRRSSAQGNSWRASASRKLLGARERLIGAMLIANNVVNIGASAFTTTIFVAIFRRCRRDLRNGRDVRPGRRLRGGSPEDACCHQSRPDRTALGTLRVVRGRAARTDIAGHRGLHARLSAAVRRFASARTSRSFRPMRNCVALSTFSRRKARS